MSKTIEELERRIKEQEVERNDLEFKNTEDGHKHDQNYRKIDLFCSEQEVVRRGIETLMNILRIENRATTNSHGVLPCLDNATRKSAEKVLNTFINELKAKPSV